MSQQPLELRDVISAEVLNHDYNSGPLLLLAGPGTGKTHSLIETIRRQLENGYSIGEFFEATLTNAAADDFLSEVQKKISPSFESAKTLHYRAKGILHKYASHIGINPGFAVIDKNCEGLILQDLEEICGLDGEEFKLALDSYKWSSAQCAIDEDCFSQNYQLIQSFYSVLDWYDVVSRVCQLLEANDQVRDEVSNEHRFLLIDEYQDLNPADQFLIQLLLNGRGTLLAVGDDDQSIYSGRYADPSGIRQFTERYPEARVLQLPVTSRLPTTVITASDSLVSRNESRADKETLIALPETDERADNGFVISVNNKSDKAEKQFIFEALLTLIQSGVPPKEILVLCSCRALGIELIEELDALDEGNVLPIQNDLEQQRDMCPEEYLLVQLRRFVNNQHDNLAARFVLHEISDNHRDEEREIVHFAINNELSIWDALATTELKSLISHLGPLLEELRINLDALDSQADLQARLEQLVASFTPLSHLEALVTQSSDDPPDQDEQENADAFSGVRFITLHSSKGLDGDFVFIPFMEGAIGLPAQDIEEQWRLLYVALTRAKVGVVMSWAWSRRSEKRFKCSGGGGDVTYRTPSNFIQESGVSPNFEPRGSARNSPEAAIDLLHGHAQSLMRNN